MPKSAIIKTLIDKAKIIFKMSQSIGDVLPLKSNNTDERWQETDVDNSGAMMDIGIRRNFIFLLRRKNESMKLYPSIINITSA